MRTIDPEPIAELFDCLIEALVAHGDAEFFLARMIEIGYANSEDAERLSGLCAKTACQLRQLKEVVCGADIKADG